MRENESGLSFLDRHFSASLTNLSEGRVYTLVTSSFGANGNITGGGLAESCTFLLFGGNLLRSFGFRSVVALYLCGHLALTSTFLFFNHLQVRDIEKYQENVAQPGTWPTLTYTPRSDRRALVLTIARQTNENNPGHVKASEEQQRAIIRMPESEFLEYARKHYMDKKAVPVGGGLLLTLLGLRLHPLAFLPVPYVPIPILGFVPVQVFACIASFDDYPKETMILSLAPMALAALGSVYFLPKGNLLRHLPIELIEQMKVPNWVPRHIPDTRAADVQQAATEATQLAKKIHLPQQHIAKEQLEAMRKRNAKFQQKNK